MNIQDFEQNVRSGLTPVAPTGQLSLLIDRRLDAIRRRKTVRRRMSLAFWATAAISATLLVFPTLKAQAELRRITGALDNVRSVIMTNESISPTGDHRLDGRVSYLDGRWKIEFPGRQLSYFVNGTLYRLERAEGHFVVEQGRKGPFFNNPSSLSLSSLLGDIQHWQPRVHVDIDQSKLHGTTVTRAIIEDPKDPDRVVIYAATDTDLPIELDSEASEDGRWVTTQVQSFDYRTQQSVSSFVPDLQTYPPIDKKTFDANRIKSLTAGEAGSLSLDKGRLVVRSVDVAEDGTVFVTCQAGERIARWNRGYPVDIADNLGTKYALQQVESEIDPAAIANSKDGKIELCVFIPSEPIDTWKPRTITVTARLEGNRHLNRREWGMWATRQGHTTSMIWYYDKSKPVSVEQVAKKAFEHPSVEAFPAYASVIDPSAFDDAGHYEEEKAKCRADFYRGLEDKGNELKWLHETIRLQKKPDGNSMAKDRLEEIQSR